MKRLGIIALFFLLNFGALAIGGILMGGGVTSDWFKALIKPPWMPPGWVFGAAWTFVMVCYSLYMGIAWGRIRRRPLVASYVIQLLLNILWNPLFFYFQETATALVVILFLTLIILVQLIVFNKKMKWSSALILPYVIWLGIATSLNLYIVLAN